MVRKEHRAQIVKRAQERTPSQLAREFRINVATVKCIYREEGLVIWKGKRKK